MGGSTNGAECATVQPYYNRLPRPSQYIFGFPALPVNLRHSHMTPPERRIHPRVAIVRTSSRTDLTARRCGGQGKPGPCGGGRCPQLPGSRACRIHPGTAGVPPASSISLHLPEWLPGPANCTPSHSHARRSDQIPFSLLPRGTGFLVSAVAASENSFDISVGENI